MAETYTVVEPLCAAAMPRLEERLGALLANGARVITYDLSCVDDAQLAAVEAVARLQLAARRRGAQIRLTCVRPELAGLLDLAGLGELLER